VTKICEFFAKTYPVLNHDLVVTAAMLHDIGKVYELSPFPQNDYTDGGQLLGHIVIGYEVVGEKIKNIPGFPEKLAREVKHCILAHHGELEYGSPKKPALAEAFAINLADNADAKLETLTELLALVLNMTATQSLFRSQAARILRCTMLRRRSSPLTAQELYRTKLPISIPLFVLTARIRSRFLLKATAVLKGI
jgi:23S rRNA maturation-related 3'-5' exoribonuclease YhaM